MVVGQIVDRREAMAILKTKNVWEDDEHLIGAEGKCSLLNLNRQVPLTVTKNLLFKSKDGPVGLKFVSKTKLDTQTVRAIRELTKESAQLLDSIIAETDRFQNDGTSVTITPEMFSAKQEYIENDDFHPPEEISHGSIYCEGNVRRIMVNRYERDSGARSACIEEHEARCCICGFDFGKVYGPEAAGHIHVHHIRPLSECGGEYEVDPINDLRPVCPNCHAVIHLGGQCRTVDEVRDMIREQASWLVRQDNLHKQLGVDETQPD